MGSNTGVVGRRMVVGMGAAGGNQGTQVAEAELDKQENLVGGNLQQVVGWGKEHWPQAAAVVDIQDRGSVLGK